MFAVASTPDGASVFVDGEAKGTTPAQVAVAPGRHQLVVLGEDSGRSCPNDERISVAPGPHKIGLYSVRTGEMHEAEHEVTEGNNSTRVYVRY